MFMKKIFGIGLNSFSRMDGIYFIPDYEMIVLENTLEDKLLRKHARIRITRRDPVRNKNTLNVLRKAVENKWVPKNSYNIVYIDTERIEKVAKENNFHIVGCVADKFEIFYKIRMRAAAEKMNIPVVPGEILKTRNFSYVKVKKKDRQFVVQNSDSSGGRGTFFINSESQWKKIRHKLENEIIAMKYIEADPVSISCCIIGSEVLYTKPQMQLIGLKQCTNMKFRFCGHDWAMPISNTAKKLAYDYAEKIGEHLKIQGYKGIFGLDMLRYKNTIYLSECNPRMVGTFPVLSMLQHFYKEPLLMKYHVKAFLNQKPDVSSKDMQKRKIGSQIILYNKQKTDVNTGNILRPGVYSQKTLEYLRPGFDLTEVHRNEFLLTGGIYDGDHVFKPDNQLLRIVAREGVSSGNGLNKKWAGIVNRVYEKMDIKTLLYKTTQTQTHRRKISKGSLGNHMG